MNTKRTLQHKTRTNLQKGMFQLNVMKEQQQKSVIIEPIPQSWWNACDQGEVGQSSVKDTLIWISTLSREMIGIIGLNRPFFFSDSVIG